ncbi:autophagy-related protein 17 [Sordaria brevicollis]|uniref:Autophagy-related protein 17 n=1 Tax=Sordaria brevicollis TaxID=83679 RepID=A0AAE0UD92_SORBR|nr:autophagy-related protein 17 [Sordaria brevicollis]
MASFPSHSHSPSPAGLSPENDNNPQPRRSSRTSLHDAPAAAHSSRPPSRDPEDEAAHSSEINTDDDVPVEVLVKHLLAAKQSLSSMTLVLRANDLATSARQMHEESVILSAQTEFLRHGILEEMRILQQVRRGMQRAYDIGTRDFKQIIRDLDTINKRLENIMDILRNTTVESVFRQPGEEGPKCLLDFIDIKVVEQVRDALKVSVDELQAAKTSFDGDLLRFDTDLRTLTDALAAAASLANPPDTTDGLYPPDQRSIPSLLSTMSEGSHLMAEHLSSLTRHFDMCVTAVRTTEGGAALARRRAAEATFSSSTSSSSHHHHELPAVSISGIIPSQETTSPSSFEPMDPLDRHELLSIVLRDASEVDDVVADIHTVLSQMTASHSSLASFFSSVRSRHAATLSCFALLEEIGARVSTSYISAETEFVARWEDEKEAIAENAGRMEELQRFYEGYLDAYDGLVLEVKRRKQVEEKIEGVWKKARREVDKLVEADKRDREYFRLEVGDYVPADLGGMRGVIRKKMGKKRE